MATTTMFSGNSRYASDFQSVIDRAVAIASLPLAQLNNTKLSLNNESAALTSLQTKLSTFQSTVNGIQSALGSASYQTTVSPEGAVTASVGSGATDATYTLEVTSLGSYANSMSKDTLPTVADPENESVTEATSLNLMVGAKSFTIKPAGTGLNDLVTAINGSGAGVRASIVNVGSTSSPSYRLSVQNSSLGQVAIQLNDGEGDLLNTLASGSLATYKVNGLSAEVQSDSRSVTLAPGLTVTLGQVSNENEATTIQVNRSTSSLQAALQQFATAYNAVIGELDLHRGSATGALAGHPVLATVGTALRDMANYGGGTGDLSTLANLGLEFDKEGQLSLDATEFAKATSGDFADTEAFLGSEADGGFLKAAKDAFKSLLDTNAGILPGSISLVNNQMSRQDKQIDETQQQIDELQTRLESQMAAADAMIASLEQQANYMNNLFESMRAASESLNG